MRLQLTNNNVADCRFEPLAYGSPKIINLICDIISFHSVTRLALALTRSQNHIHIKTGSENRSRTDIFKVMSLAVKPLSLLAIGTVEGIRTLVTLIESQTS